MRVAPIVLLALIIPTAAAAEDTANLHGEARFRGMVPELLLVSVFVGAGGTVGYLVYDHLRARRQAEERRAAERLLFRESLVRELRLRKPAGFRFDDFVAECRVDRDDADAAADEVYLGLCRKVVADGVVTDEERRKLAVLAGALAIDGGRAAQIESQAKGEAYERAVGDALADGVVTAEEAAELEALRRSLGIGGREAVAMTGVASRDAYLEQLRRIARFGQVTPSALESLDDLKRGLALTGEEVARLVRDKALDIYRECVTAVLQDGVVTAEEEATLRWLRHEVGLSAAEADADDQRIRRTKALAGYRAGNLPALGTRRLLEGGETCHWEGPCSFSYRTRTKYLTAGGELLVTSKRLVFVSPTKNFTFAPSKIIDITRSRGAVEVQVGSGQGTGRYAIADPEELEAVLCGVVRKHKYLLSESYTAAKTRHIPDQVKRDVWDRDGGRCVRCGTADYLVGLAPIPRYFN
jgi:hypothetical protein